MDSSRLGKKALLKSPNVKRRNKVVPLSQRVTLDKVLGFTLSNGAGLTCDPTTGTIAYPAGCVVVLFNLHKNKQTHIFNASKKTITAVAFSGDGKHIATGESGHLPAVRVWDVEDRTQVAEFHGHGFGISCVAFSPNLKYLVSIGSQHDMIVNLWNWKTNNKVASNKISSKVSAVSFAETGNYFVTVGNRHVKFWYLDTSKAKINETVPLLGRLGILGDKKNNFFSDVVCGRGKTANSTFCITGSGVLCEFNQKRVLVKWVKLNTKSANSMCVGQDQIFIGCAEGVVRVFSVVSLQFVATLPKPHYLGIDVSAATNASHMIPHKDNDRYPDTIATVLDDKAQKLTCVYNDHSLYTWDVHDVKKVGKLWSSLYHSSSIWGLEVCPVLSDKQVEVVPPGSFITCSSDDTIRIWNIEPRMSESTAYKRNIFSNELLKVAYIDPSHEHLCDVDYNPAGKTDKTDMSYDGKNGIRSIRVSPDGRQLASGDRLGNLRVHDLHFMDEVAVIEAHDAEILTLEYSNFPSGPKLLASGSRDRFVHVFATDQDYSLIQTLDDHSSSITSLHFTNDQDQLKMLSCGADKSILFRTAQLSPSFQFVLSQHLVSKTTLYDMDIDPTKQFAATAGQDRNIRIYNIKTAKQKKCYKGSVSDEGVLIKVQPDPSGIYLATSCTDKSLCVLDFYTGEILATMFGHSEVATGVKFTNDLKHLISVSGDGCIFVWRLSPEFTKQMRQRYEELGRILPKETENNHDMRRRDTYVMQKPVMLNQGSTVGNPFQISPEFTFYTPSKLLEIIHGVPSCDSDSTKLSNANTVSEQVFNINSSSSLVAKNFDKLFNGAEIPKWAKLQMENEQMNGECDEDEDGDTVGDVNRLGDDIDAGARQRRRWSQTVHSPGLKLKSMLDGERSIEVLLHSHEQRRSAIDSESSLSSFLLSESEDTHVKTVPITTDDDDNIEDDSDFRPASISPSSQNNSQSDLSGLVNTSVASIDLTKSGIDSWSHASVGGLEKDERDNEGEESIDSVSKQLIYFPPDMDDTTDSNASSYKVIGISANELKEGRSRLKPLSATDTSSIKDGDSSSTEPVSLEDAEEEEDSLSLPSTPVKNLPLDNILSKDTPDFTPIPIEKFYTNLDALEKLADVNNVFSPRQSISSRYLSRTVSSPRNVARQDNWFDDVQRRKDTMARAMDETRRRLESMGWRGGQQQSDAYYRPSGSGADDWDQSAQPTPQTNSDHDWGRPSKSPSPGPSKPPIQGMAFTRQLRRERPQRPRLVAREILDTQSGSEDEGNTRDNSATPPAFLASPNWLLKKEEDLSPTPDTQELRSPRSNGVSGRMDFPRREMATTPTGLRPSWGKTEQTSGGIAYQITDSFQPDSMPMRPLHPPTQQSSMRRSWSTADVNKDPFTFPLPPGRTSPLSSSGGYAGYIDIGECTGPAEDPNQTPVNKSHYTKATQDKNSVQMGRRSLFDRNVAGTIARESGVSQKGPKSDKDKATRPRYFIRRHSTEPLFKTLVEPVKDTSKEGPLYLKQTQSSKAKINKYISQQSLERRDSNEGKSSKSKGGSSLAKSKSFMGYGESNDTSSSRRYGDFDQQRPLSRQHHCVSVPNLATCFEEEEEDEQPSNLMEVSDLSKSVPDMFDAESSSTISDTCSTTSSTSSSLRMREPKSPPRDSVKIKRRSTPHGGTPRYSSALHDSFSRKGSQTRKRVAPEMSLEQAKAILLGKSGILSKNSSSSSASGRSGTSRGYTDLTQPLTRKGSSSDNFLSNMDRTSSPISMSDIPLTRFAPSSKFSSSKKYTPSSGPDRNISNTSKLPSNNWNFLNNKEVVIVENVSFDGDSHKQDSNSQQIRPSTSEVSDSNLVSRKYIHKSSPDIRLLSPTDDYGYNNDLPTVSLKKAKPYNGEYSTASLERSRSPARTQYHDRGEWTTSLDRKRERSPAKLQVMQQRMPSTSTPKSDDTVLQYDIEHSASPVHLNSADIDNKAHSRIKDTDIIKQYRSGSPSPAPGILQKMMMFNSKKSDTDKHTDSRGGEHGRGSLDDLLNNDNPDRSQSALGQDTALSSSYGNKEEVTNETLTVMPSKLKSKDGHLRLPWQVQNNSSNQGRPPKHQGQAGSQSTVSTGSHLPQPTARTQALAQRPQSVPPTFTSNGGTLQHPLLPSQPLSDSGMSSDTEPEQENKSSKEAPKPEPKPTHLPNMTDKDDVSLPAGNQTSEEEMALMMANSRGLVEEMNKSVHDMRSAVSKVLTICNKLSQSSHLEHQQQAQMLAQCILDAQVALTQVIKLPLPKPPIIPTALHSSKASMARPKPAPRETRSSSSTSSEKSEKSITPEKLDRTSEFAASLTKAVTSGLPPEGSANSAVMAMLQPLLEEQMSQLTEKMYSLIQQKLDTSSTDT